MAVVLSSEEDYFSAASMRRARSQQNKFIARPSSLPSSPAATRLRDPYSSIAKSYTESTSSSAPSSPQAVFQSSDSTDISFVSTPASNVSVSSSECDDAQLNFHPDDHFVLPDYDHACYPPDPLEDLEPPPSPKNGHSYTASPDNEGSDTTSRPLSPDLLKHAEDDTAVQSHPTRHVDYLAHNWTEEEIWLSWRYIVSRGKDYANAVRLENAAWRTWLKKKNNLRTVSPETLNWYVSWLFSQWEPDFANLSFFVSVSRLKECDVTWLYGPLQTRENTSRAERRSSNMSKTNGFIKKPILKKRSMSEIMLRRSLSNSSLLKEAAAAVQAQEKDGRRLERPRLNRAATTTDYVTFPFSSRRTSKDTSVYTSSATSGIVSPNSERKRIHFNEQVEQCIAVDIKGDDDGEDTPVYMHDGSESDDGAMMMRRPTRRRKKAPTLRKKSKPKNSDGKTIAMLPSTTLKDRQEFLGPETALKHGGLTPDGQLLSPSSSQETLRGDGPKPRKSKGWFFGGEDSDEELNGYDFDGVYRDQSQLAENDLDQAHTPPVDDLDLDGTGVRRTASGMFLPCDDMELPTPNDGVFSRILDTVNTARDIAHVIWNVGWRK